MCAFGFKICLCGIHRKPLVGCWKSFNMNKWLEYIYCYLTVKHTVNILILLIFFRQKDEKANSIKELKNT